MKYPLFTLKKHTNSQKNCLTPQLILESYMIYFLAIGKKTIKKSPKHRYLRITEVQFNEILPSYCKTIRIFNYQFEFLPSEYKLLWNFKSIHALDKFLWIKVVQLLQFWNSAVVTLGLKLSICWYTYCLYHKLNETLK